MIVLVFLFFIVAFVYSLAGLGGGSSYLALLALFGVPHGDIPTIALLCNLVVVVVAGRHFLRQDYRCLRLVIPFVVSSMPAAYLGGRWAVGQKTFILLLGGCLFVSGLCMIFFKSLEEGQDAACVPQKILWTRGFPIGAVLGYLAGVVGIGGGIFLLPVLNHLRWGKVKQTAAVVSVFIGLNSVSGLVGRFAMGGQMGVIRDYALLPLAVFFGGQLGSYWGACCLSPGILKKFMGLLILGVGVRLLLEGMSLF